MTQAEQIMVDLAYLRDIWHSLKSNLEGDLGPGLAYTDAKISQRAQVGAEWPSAELESARLALAYTLSRNQDNFAAHVRRVEHMVNFLDLIVTRYRDVDDLLAAKTQEVEALFLESSPPPKPQQVPEPTQMHGLLP